MKYSAVSKAALGLEREMAKDKGLREEVQKLISNFEAWTSPVFFSLFSVTR